MNCVSRHFSLHAWSVAAILALGPVLVHAQGVHEATPPASRLQWVPIDGVATDTVFAVWSEGQQPFYAISVDGGATTATVRRSRTELALRYATFDPVRSVPRVPTDLAARDGAHLWLVQFLTQGIGDHRRALTALGAEIVHFAPHQGHVVRMDEATRLAVEALSFVRWIGPYHPAYRTEEAVLRELRAGGATTRRYDIHVTVAGPTEKAAVATAIAGLGGIVDAYVSPHGYLLTAELSSSQLVEVLHRDDVLFVDRWSPPSPDMDSARIQGGANYVEAVGGYTGAGVRAQVRDSGLTFNHPDFGLAPIPHSVFGGDTFHGTSVYGIVFGNGATNPAARGMMPDAQGVFFSYQFIVDRYVETAETLQDPYRCVFETNSWGNGLTTQYTNVSADMDNILFDHDIVIMQSQSNAGGSGEPRDSRPQAWAKNIVSVGGIRHHDTTNLADDCWLCPGFGSAASIGPAADGRIKPNISAYYDLTLTVFHQGGHANFSGTSGATPIVAGHMGLLHQMWADGIFGNPLVSWDVFENKPKATLARALLYNSASQYPFIGSEDDLARVHQGWGRPDLQNLYDRRDRLFWVNETDVLTELQSTLHTVTVGANDPELRATLVYLDPPGDPMAMVHRINDLTLRVTDPVGTVYWGNFGLLDDPASLAGGTPDTVDTVEQVIVPSPMAGAWTVEVIASEVNADAHLETPVDDVDYALVVRGVDPVPAPTPDTGQANQADASLRIVDSVNLAQQRPKVGVRGPFFVTRSPGEVLGLEFESAPNRPFLLFFGPLNRANATFGVVGQLDLGLGGLGNLSDVSILIDGITPTTILDLLGKTGPTGTQELSFSLPNLPPGTIGAFQAVMWDVLGGVVRLSAATEVTIQ